MEAMQLKLHSLLGTNLLQAPAMLAPWVYPALNSDTLA
jgi:hypothetical protein